MPESGKEAERPDGPLEVDSPIINSPFYEPCFHWRIRKGEPPVKAEGRRPASYYFRVPGHEMGLLEVLDRRRYQV